MSGESAGSQITRLDSGLVVVTDTMPHLRTASLGIWAGAGARFEDPAENGISHLLEHMAFKGTKRRTALMIAEEIERLADWIEAKRLEKTNEDKDLIVMGDFNIPSRDDALFKAITKHALQVPKPLLGAHGTNLEKNKRYDQLLHYPIYPDSFTKAGGEVDFYIDAAHIKELFPAGLTKEKFTFQLSDHLPLWLQINTDIEGEQLEFPLRPKPRE